MTNDIDVLLKPYGHLGDHLDLTRIQKLLADLDNPHHHIPIIHVAGTNGKGSVCAYLSSVLTEAGYRVGRYTSPHLVNWNERICINEQPISSSALVDLLLEINSLTKSYSQSPTQFEVLTAASWLHFAHQQVDLAVIEVGLGGRLDATNVCDRSLVSIITSISRDHWQVLGSTLAEIAAEKAGILKPHCPAVIGILPPAAQSVIETKINTLSCPAIFPSPAVNLGDGWAEYQGIKYYLPLLGDFQLANSALAIAACQILREQSWLISDQAIAQGMTKTKWPGRLQWQQWGNQRLLIDGAHNPGAAQVLRQYVDTLNTPPITWLIGMLVTKDHSEIFRALLRPQDHLYLVPVPDSPTANPEELAILAQNICPELTTVQTYPTLVNALTAAFQTNPSLVVLCGSLYLIGHYYTLTSGADFQVDVN